MSALKDKLVADFPKFRDEIAALVKEHGDVKISEVTNSQAYGGMSGVNGLVCDTSEVPPDRGLIIRGIPIGDLTEKSPEEVFWLLLTGELPTKAQVKDLSDDLKSRAKVPDYVWKVLEAMPKDSHPMAMFDTAILVMEKESKFRLNYDLGMKKSDYWVWTLEDALDIVAKLPEIAAGVYRLRFNKGPRIPFDPSLDWSGNYVKMLGLGDPGGKFTECMKLYLVLHSDHESGNVSAHTTFCVNSALSDLYYSLSAGLNGLAGPLHGLANQECLGWVLETKKKFGGVPTEKQLHDFAWETLNSGKVVPGYGHAVLRITDPRFTAFLAWGKKNIPEDETFQLVARVFDVVPEVLKQVQKIKYPWPNVDAGSGALLYHFGLTEFPYYTVLFSVSRALGVCAQAVVARAMGWPLERPKSVTTKWLKGKAS
ncbi:MAG: citrate (Si)-synthase [candidate division Zixibacteria bacterium]|nr:citrate (Si)-synthase [candidate division Zixibacteria bacterium]